MRDMRTVVRQDHGPLGNRCTRISIHAPRAGCDCFRNFSAVKIKRFQSTHPMRGATARKSSIVPNVLHFNPRTPCGVRPPAYCSSSSGIVFQSTHPMRGATASINTTATNQLFQSTHPMRGATFILRSFFQPQMSFQSTHPMRGATLSRRSGRKGCCYFNPRTPCGVRHHLLA